MSALRPFGVERPPIYGEVLSTNPTLREASGDYASLLERLGVSYADLAKILPIPNTTTFSIGQDPSFQLDPQVPSYDEAIAANVKELAQTNPERIIQFTPQQYIDLPPAQRREQLLLEGQRLRSQLENGKNIRRENANKPFVVTFFDRYGRQMVLVLALVAGLGPSLVACSVNQIENTSTPSAITITTAEPENQLQLFEDVVNADIQEQVAIVNFKAPTNGTPLTPDQQKMLNRQQALFNQLTSQETGWLTNDNKTAPMVDPYNENGQSLTNVHGFILNKLQPQDGNQYWLFVTLNPRDSSQLMLTIVDQGKSYIWYGFEDGNNPNGNQDTVPTGALNGLRPISRYNIVETKGRVVDMVFFNKVSPSQAANEKGHIDMTTYDAFERAHLTANQEFTRVLLGQEAPPAYCPWIIDNINKLDLATLQANANKLPGSAWVYEPSWFNPGN